MTPENSLLHSARESDIWCIGYLPLYFHLMTQSKDIRPQEGVPTPQSGSPTTNVTWIGQKHAKSKPPYNSMFGSVKGSDSHDINNQSLYFH